MKILKNIVKTGFLVVLAAILTACPPKKKPITPVEAPPETEEAAELDENAFEIGPEWVAVPRLETIYFPTNKSDLEADARAALKRNAPVLKAVLAQAPGVQIRVEGHCDERNTLEYNLALGQRRANSVREYYANLGVAKKALMTVSYGEERPVCTTSDENCWSQNRRAVTTARSGAGPIRIPLDKPPAALP